MKDNFFDKNIRPLLRHKVFSLVIILVAMVVVFSLWSMLFTTGQFFKASTFWNILNSVVLSAFLAIGAGCLLLSGNMDLSIAAIGAFGGMIFAVAIQYWGLHWIISMVISLVFSALLGAANATMITKFRFPAFIATLAMASMSKGMMFIFSTIGKGGGSAANVSVYDQPALEFIGNAKIGPIPFGVLVIVIFFLVYGFMVAKSKFGMKIMMMGGNPTAATLAGISSTKITYILFMNSAMLGCLAGIVQTSRLGQGSLTALQNNQFTGITAAILGGISFGGGAGGMGGAFVGLLILNTFQIGMNTVGVNPFWVNVFSGVILLIALAVDFLSQKRMGNLKSA